MKYSTLVIAALLVGCGSESQNPFQIAADEPEQAVQTQEQITQPVQTVQPAVEPAPVTSQPVVVTQPEPVQPVPQEPVETPICEGTGTGWGWENNASCIYAQVVVQPQIEIEPEPEPIVVPDDDPDIVEPYEFASWIGQDLECFNVAGLMKFYFTPDGYYNAYIQNRAGGWLDLESGAWIASRGSLTTVTESGTSRGWEIQELDGYLVNTDMMWSCAPPI